MSLVQTFGSTKCSLAKGSFGSDYSFGSTPGQTRSELVKDGKRVKSRASGRQWSSPFWSAGSGQAAWSDDSVRLTRSNRVNSVKVSRSTQLTRSTQ
ncbi:hypothetical protein Hdeb2414_s0002g00059931 [Helianthus debilis subsp. tardiflorus]